MDKQMKKTIAKTWIQEYIMKLIIEQPEYQDVLLEINLEILN